MAASSCSCGGLSLLQGSGGVVRMMGSGPRTHPGGVSDRDWRRAQRRLRWEAQKEHERHARERAKLKHSQLMSLIHRLHTHPPDPAPPEPYDPAAQDRPQRPAVFRASDGRASHRFFPPGAIFSTRMYRQLSYREPQPTYQGAESEEQGHVSAAESPFKLGGG